MTRSILITTLLLAVAASSSAMICRMEERISSIEGSFAAALFIPASLILAPTRPCRLARPCHPKTGCSGFPLPRTA